MDVFEIMDVVFNSETLIALLTLTALEIVLGIDNIIFISILSGKLPVQQQPQARIMGLALAMGTRILLLFSLFWVMGLTKPMFELFGHGIAGRDLILIIGGLFLIGKSTHEIHEKVHDVEEHTGSVHVKKPPSFGSALVQIALLDIVFSLDSVITAVGMVDQIWIMVAAVVIAVAVMMVFSNWVSAFIDKNPTIKMLALSFLLLIGVVLVAEGFGQHIPKGYIYFAMAYSAFVEMLNMRIRGRQTPAPVDPAREKQLS